jgi:hypothetical protein
MADCKELDEAFLVSANPAYQPKKQRDLALH